MELLPPVRGTRDCIVYKLKANEEVNARFLGKALNYSFIFLSLNIIWVPSSQSVDYDQCGSVVLETVVMSKLVTR